MSKSSEEYLDDEDGNEEESLEGDEIDGFEEGFMKGYKDKNTATCAMCGKVLRDADGTIEIDIDDETYRFCSERCAERFKKQV
ncbi:hypothetical protein J4455_03670 [Candidatus Woesearchaeota archaeon]|nr:hypothetical protein [Candidatus Woesearchaeota archaeon]